MTIADGSAVFETKWSMAGHASIPRASDGDIAISNTTTSFEEIDDPGLFEFAGHSKHAREGQIVMFRGDRGYALVRVDSVLAGPGGPFPHYVNGFPINTPPPPKTIPSPPSSLPHPPPPPPALRHEAQVSLERQFSQQVMRADSVAQAMSADGCVVQYEFDRVSEGGGLEGRSEVISRPGAPVAQPDARYPASVGSRNVGIGAVADHPAARQRLTAALGGDCQQPNVWLPVAFDPGDTPGIHESVKACGAGFVFLAGSAIGDDRHAPSLLTGSDQGTADRIFAVQEWNELPVVILNEVIDRRGLGEPLVENLEEVALRAVDAYVLLTFDEPAQETVLVVRRGEVGCPSSKRGGTVQQGVVKIAEKQGHTPTDLAGSGPEHSKVLQRGTTPRVGARRLLP